MSPLPTPAPAPWWTQPCNTPPEQFIDGCDDWTPIAPPDTLLPPPCVHSAHVEHLPNDDDPTTLDTHLVIIIDHPEYEDGQTQQVRVIRRLPSGGEPAPSSSRGTEGGWQTDYGDWSYKCGRDEAPLAWTVTEMLNTRVLPNVYDQPLPTPLLALIAYASDTPALAAADAGHRLYPPLTLRAHPR